MEQTYYIIYETINLVNDMKYRGAHKTKNIDDGYLGSGILLQKAIKKYSSENFKRVVLEYCNSVEHMYQRESWWVDDEWVKRKDTYNVTVGGRGRRGLTDEGRRAIGNANKLRMTDSVKEKVSNGVKKHHNTKEFKEYLSIKTSEALRKQGMKEKLATNKGKKASEETKRKKSESMKRHWQKRKPMELLVNKRESEKDRR